MMLQTERLTLRPWELRDVDAMFFYARDPEVGPPAGWPPHKDMAESKRIVEMLMACPETYAICLKGTDDPIGCIDLKLKDRTDLTDRDDEGELGYWLGKPYWGRGIMPEAARGMLHHAFEDLGMQKVWCAYYDGNEKSKRVQEKVGFRYQWTTEGVDVPLLGEKRTGHVNSMTKEEWDQIKKGALS